MLPAFADRFNNRPSTPWSSVVRQALRHPIKTLLDSYAYWREHGSRVRHARVLCRCGDTMRIRRVRGFEQRAPGLYRRARRSLEGLAAPAASPAEDPGRTAHQALAIAQRPYRAAAQAATVVGLALAVLAFAVVATGSLFSDGMRARFFPRDLAAGQPWTASSSEHGFPSSGQGPSTEGLTLFHTKFENRPWIEIDLGGEHIISGFSVGNRTECCKERALPLNFEIFDGRGWRLIAQRRTPFSTWHCDIDMVRAQRVRILRPGDTFLHLQRISVYGR
jgi:hypothetical protein